VGPATRACITAGAKASFSAPTDTPDWRLEARVIVDSRLSEIATSLLDASSLDLPPDLDQYFRARSRIDAMRTLRVEATATRALRRLHEKSIPFLVIKGPAVARFHARPDTRPYTDIDLVVPPRYFTFAARELSELGYRQDGRGRPPWDWFDLQCREGANYRNGPVANIDLHHHIAPWVFGQQLDAQTMLLRSEPGKIAGVPVRLAGLEDSLLIASLHILNDLGKGDPSLMTWRDTIVLAELLGPERAAESYCRAGLAWFLPYVQSTHRYLTNLDPNESTRETRPDDQSQSARLRALGWEGSTFAARSPIMPVARLPFPRALLFIAGSLFPSPQYAKEKHNGYWAYWIKGVRSLWESARGVDFRVTDIGARVEPAHPPASLS
jgi:hypothetical protein